MFRWIAIAALAATSAQAGARGPAYATGTAQLEWHHEQLDKVILDELIWRCSGDICSGPVPAEQRVALARQCSRLSKYGRVISFRTPSVEFSADALKRCNR